MKEPKRSEFIEEKLKEFDGMRPLLSGAMNEEEAKAMAHLQGILDQWWNRASVYKEWLKKTLEEASQ